MNENLRILCLGDIVGRPGRKALKDRLRIFREAQALDMVIANGENAAGGIGLSPETARELFGAGVDVLTSGNHVWKHRELYPFLDANKAVLRPANYGPAVPGRGVAVYDVAGVRVGVVNLLGRTFMEPAACPFAAADAALDVCKNEGAQSVIVDFHAEASSEKRAMAHHLDGRASLVFGTHTHVQTADAAISASGTASLTDIGMCGVEEASVIGMSKEKVLRRFITGLPQPFIPAKGEPTVNGIIVEVAKNTGKALSISLVRSTAPSVSVW